MSRGHEVVTYDGTIQAIIHAHRCDCLLIPYATTKVASIETAPEGMLMSAASLGSVNPRFLINVAE